MNRPVTDDIQTLIDLFPRKLSQAILKVNHVEHLMEIVLDVGRPPTAVFDNEEVELFPEKITEKALADIVARLGKFDTDNRVGINGTLHRISALKNRHGKIVGLTCRVGRAVYGSLSGLENLLLEDKNILILGRPGIGKTTLLREMARVLSQKKRVVIVDTSNEIGGDGDTPHPGVGRARRIQVANPLLQHEVMIEAVENHNPQVIIIDEIGRESEAKAARTIAERGVQLIGTAHGNSLENLMLNPPLSDLIGGVHAVVISDDMAKMRGCQKTVSERRAPPTFDVVVEIIQKNKFAIHYQVGEDVDAMLVGKPVIPEVRYLNEKGEVVIERESSDYLQEGKNGHNDLNKFAIGSTRTKNTRRTTKRPLAERRILPYGLSGKTLQKAINKLNAPLAVATNYQNSDLILTTKQKMNSNDSFLNQAITDKVEVVVIDSNKTINVEKYIASVVK